MNKTNSPAHDFIPNRVVNLHDQTPVGDQTPVADKPPVPKPTRPKVVRESPIFKVPHYASERPRLQFTRANKETPKQSTIAKIKSKLAVKKKIQKGTRGVNPASQSG